jgi:hypothetical protein
MVHSIAHLPVLPQTRLLPILLQQSVQHSRMALKRVGPRRLMALGQGLRSLRHTPEFAFAHAYAQAVRFHWSSFEARVGAGVHDEMLGSECPVLQWTQTTSWDGCLLFCTQCRILLAVLHVPTAWRYVPCSMCSAACHEICVPNTDSVTL